MKKILTKKIMSALQLEKNEVQPFLWSFTFFFSLLCSYYILRPVRDEMGIQGGINALQWVFSATFIVMLLVVPLFGWVVKRYSSVKLVPRVYYFFIVNLLIFYILFQSNVNNILVARIFFIWVSIFNLFVVSIFWSFMSDIFTSKQARRMFGSIAAGGSAGAIFGPAITVLLSNILGQKKLLLVSVGFLVLSLICISKLIKIMKQDQRSLEKNDNIGGSIFAGITRVLQSPYLMGISLFILLYSTLSTFLYFEQAHIIKNAFDSPESRTTLFAIIDLTVNTMTIFTQIFLTSRLVEKIGLSFTLMLIPVLVAVGFIALGFFPTLLTLVTFQVIRRAGNYAVTRPAREMLYTTLPIQDKYKSKNFIDTVIYRGGDATSSWIFSGLKELGLNLSSLSFIAVPIAFIWALSGYLLGKAHKKKSSISKESNEV